MNFSSINSSSIFNISVLVTTTGEDSRIFEKYLIIDVKDKKDFNFTLSNNKVENNNSIFCCSNFDYLDYGKFS